MGIKLLNTYFKNEVKDSIKLTPLSELSGKKIAIDTSIYLYKYATEDALIENIYLMLSIFRYYDIVPIFVFDGEGRPDEKKEIIAKRKQDKKEAKSEFLKLKKKLDSDSEQLDNNEKQELLNAMDLLKKRFVSISKEQKQTVKELIQAYGVTYYEAPEEADGFCALLTITGKVWGCLSDDTDMFAYGCPRVLRYLSLINHTVVVYDLKGILAELKLTQDELREICVISGTDYNIDVSDNKNIFVMMKHFKKYKKSKSQDTFYDWLANDKEFSLDKEVLKKINELFILKDDKKTMKIIKHIKIMNGPINQSNVRKILKNDGFIFP